MNFENQTIGLASDHAGFETKKIICEHLANRGLQYIDYGVFSSERSDYPDEAHKLGKAIESGTLEMGIATCGTGNGVAMVLNKYPHIRAGLCWNKEIAGLISAHNKANVLVLPARFLNKTEVIEIIDAYLDTPFEGGRHQMRIDKI
ncbi:MAG: RpiB/LacA/LacB family sugar-phosphate isomerase [Tannerella sp.]|jgi:ribose 5-phosphate isomerase B|nr:RpiB/LacA/LacB family sugar-phosphate isomerase [Tannerella sp.]